MSWIFLGIAGILEMVWAVGLKVSHGFSQFLPSILTIIAMMASFGFLALALKQLPLSIAYAVWTGIGIIGTTLAGVFFFGESMTFLHLLCIASIALGIVGLRLIS